MADLEAMGYFWSPNRSLSSVLNIQLGFASFSLPCSSEGGCASSCSTTMFVIIFLSLLQSNLFLGRTPTSLLGPSSIFFQLQYCPGPIVFICDYSFKQALFLVQFLNTHEGTACLGFSWLVQNYLLLLLGKKQFSLTAFCEKEWEGSLGWGGWAKTHPVLQKE